jgi:gliding motility-associated-like protein
MTTKTFTGLLIAVVLCMLPVRSIYAQSCDYQGGQNDDWIFDKRCAPVTVERIVTFRGVDDGGTGDVSIYFDWGDGSDPDIIPATEISAGNWQANATHIYPPGGDQCNYEADAYLMVDGVLCTSSVQTQTATVWDIDNQNGGNINISPEVFPICIGDDGAVQFTDVSQWNCTPPDEEDTPNYRNRWTQWIYGTGSTNISTAEVAGNTYSWPYAGPINHYNADTVLAPSPPFALSENIYIPAGYDVGDHFIVTIRNWNACNPYDDPSIAGPPADPDNGDHDPVISTAMVVIVDLPDSSIDPAGPFCETDAPYTLNPATPGGTWSGPGTDPATGVFTPADAGPGTHTIYYNVTSSDGCSATGSVNIEVREAPNIEITPGDTAFLCPGLDLQLNANISAGTPPYSFQWTGDTVPLSDTGIQNPEFNTSVVGSYMLTVTVTDDTGCSNQSVIVIEVEDVSVDFDPNPVEVCAGTPAELIPITSGESTTYVSHQWSGAHIDKLSDTNTANPEFFSTETGTFEFTYEVIDDMGCSDQTNITVIVKEQPVAHAGPDEQICASEYQLQGNNSSGTALWTVISGPGNLDIEDSSLFNSLVTADTYGTYELVWSLDIDGCTDRDTVALTFSETPVPSVADDYQICGLDATIEAFPDMAGGEWSVTSGHGNATILDATSSTSEVNVEEPGIYTFTWREVSPDGCTAEASQTIEFMPQAVADIAPFTDEGCSPIEITFENNSLNADSYQWNFGDGSSSSQENPTHIFVASSNVPDTVIIELQAQNDYGCNDTSFYELIVKPVPVASFEATPADGCSPLEVTFANTSSEGQNYTWNFGDNSPEVNDKDPAHTFVNTETYVQSYLVELIAENQYGCTDLQTHYITVYPVREISLTANPQSGCAPLSTQLTTESGAREYHWNFGDGNTETGEYQTSHVFENNTTDSVLYTVKVTGISSFGCTEEASTDVVVHATPDPVFTAIPEEQQMPDNTITIDNRTTGNWNYLWTFGDGTTSEEQHSGDHKYSYSGDYEISLLAYSEHCEASYSKTISIIPMVPDISYGPDTAGCPPLTVNFYNNTIDAKTFLWDFGDGQYSDEKNPTHTYRIPGKYKVSLTAYGTGGETTVNDVIVEAYPTPSALFEPVPKVVYIPNDGVTFLNKSEGAVSYLWFFGDGNTSHDFSPTHIYQETGSYDVTLLVNNEYNCSDELTIPNAVKALQGGEIDFPNAFTPNKNGPSDGHYQYGDRNNHVFYPFLQKGIVEYRLQIFSRWGELLFESNDINRGWDGYYKNNLCPQGVYIWRVTATLSDGRRIEKTGDVTLLR